MSPVFYPFVFFLSSIIDFFFNYFHDVEVYIFL